MFLKSQSLFKQATDFWKRFFPAFQANCADSLSTAKNRFTHCLIFLGNHFILIILTTVFWVFVALCGAIALFVDLCIWLYKLYQDVVSEPATVPAPSIVFSDIQIAEIVCTVLRNNATVLGIIAPENIQDILPTKHPYIKSENGFLYYHFIIPYTDIDDDFDNKLQFLQLKIVQYLMLHYSNYQLYFGDIPVIKVFRVGKSFFHPHCYDICVMLVDSQSKYDHLLSLERSSDNNGACSAPLDNEF